MQEHLQLKEPILTALMSSFQADQQKLTQSTTYLTEISKSPGIIYLILLGYCMTLMEIVDDINVNEAVKQAALIQLKNTIKRNWKAKKF
jgi:hypothetical protein